MFIYQSSREFNDLRGGEAIRPTFAQVDAHPHRGIDLEELLHLPMAALALRSYAKNDAQRPLLKVKADSHVGVR